MVIKENKDFRLKKAGKYFYVVEFKGTDIHMALKGFNNLEEAEQFFKHIEWLLDVDVRYFIINMYSGLYGKDMKGILKWEIFMN